MIGSLKIVAIVCFVLAGILLILAVFFWFHDHIPAVYADLSGRLAKKSIEEIRKETKKNLPKTRKTGPVSSIDNMKELELVPTGKTKEEKKSPPESEEGLVMLQEVLLVSTNDVIQ